MSTFGDIANAVLETIKGCVDCTKYDRFFVSIGDPVIDCSTLAVSVQGVDIAAQVAKCTLYNLRLNVTIAQCCVPVVGADGSPPSPGDITQSSLCLLDDLALITCCLQGIAIEGAGIVTPCRPVISSTSISRPSGGCQSATISLTFEGVRCCG